MCSHQECDIGERLATLSAEGGKMGIKSKKQGTHLSRDTA